MDIRKVQTYIDGICPRAHHISGHKILPIPGRDDICFVFCEGQDNRIFLVWEQDRNIRHELIGGRDGYRVIVDKNTLRLEGNILKLRCETLNFVGSSGGAQLVYKLGKLGNANPRAVQSNK